MIDKVRAVERLFGELETEMAAFQSATALHCLTGCGACCYKADIEVTVLECLPLAYHLFTEGSGEAWYDRLAANPHDTTCRFLNAFGAAGGSCSHHPWRPLLCRLFGMAATHDKHGRRQLSTCRPLKEQRADVVRVAAAWVEAGQPVPVFRSYYFRLASIDAALGSDCYPINQAFLRALEHVLWYYRWQNCEVV